VADTTGISKALSKDTEADLKRGIDAYNKQFVK